MINFNSGDEVKIILGRNRIAKVAGVESHTRGHSIRIKFAGGHEMLVPQEDILPADDPELNRIRTVYENLKQKGYNHIALIRKSGDNKIYHKGFKNTQDIFAIKKQCEDNSFDDIKNSVIKMM